VGLATPAEKMDAPHANLERFLTRDAVSLLARQKTILLKTQFAKVFSPCSLLLLPSCTGPSSKDCLSYGILNVNSPVQLECDPTCSTCNGPSSKDCLSCSISNYVSLFWARFPLNPFIFPFPFIFVLIILFWSVQ